MRPYWGSNCWCEQQSAAIDIEHIGMSIIRPWLNAAPCACIHLKCQSVSKSFLLHIDFSVCCSNTWTLKNHLAVMHCLGCRCDDLCVMFTIRASAWIGQQIHYALSSIMMSASKKYRVGLVGSRSIQKDHMAYRLLSKITNHMSSKMQTLAECVCCMGVSSIGTFSVHSPIKI